VPIGEGSKYVGTVKMEGKFVEGQIQAMLGRRALSPIAS
jgi:hypothetical protein